MKNIYDSQAPSASYQGINAPSTLDYRRSGFRDVFPTEAGKISETEAQAPTLISLFTAQVAARPQDIALTLGAHSLSYAALHDRSDALARRLTAADIGPGSIVGLCLPRSFDLIIGMLAILKSGAAYLPLDPAYPGERLAFMVEDADAAMIIGASDCTGWLPRQRRWLDPQDAGDDVSAASSAAQCPRPASPLPSDLAYVIYTSGSTGRPKGVAIEHAAVVRLFSSTQTWFNFQPTDVWALFHSVSFDFSVWEIWGALLYGGRLVIIPEAMTRDPAAFRSLLAAERVTVLNQTPSAFGAFDRADSDCAEQTPLALRFIIFGGESLDPRRLSGWYERHGAQPCLVNMYGITETTVHVTYRPLSPADTSLTGSPIGHAIPDLEILLLDGETLQPVPYGEVGELFVGGAGLARGYLNRPELTAARFIAHPKRSGERLYRSGDLARLMPSGEYQHLGRADQQVKIRGFRIELGEVEAALLSHANVREAAVTLRSDTGQDLLVGYVVLGPSAVPDPDILKAHVARSLPRHMLPAHIVFIPRLPLTVNGKLDRDALPAPSRARPETTAPYRLPRIALERQLCAIVGDVLKIENVGIDDNFFDLGGNSLLVVELHRRMRDLDAPGLNLIDLYRYPNVGRLADHLTSKRSHLATELSRAKERGAQLRNGFMLIPRRRPDGVQT